VLIYFLQGNLPWQGLNGANKKKKYENIMNCKLDTTVESLCKDLPEEFSLYVKYCRDLKFDQKPDYEMLRTMFRELMFKEELKYD